MGHYVGVSELLINMKTRCKVCAKDFLQRSSGGLGKKKKSMLRYTAALLAQ